MSDGARDKYKRALKNFSNKKMRRFVEVYAGEGAEAARIAGYSKKAARQQASRLLKRPDIQRALELRTLAEKEDSQSPPSPPTPNVVRETTEDTERVIPFPRPHALSDPPEILPATADRVDTRDDVNSVSTVRSGKSRRRARKVADDDDEKRTIEPLAEMTREEQVQRASISRQEMNGYLTGVMLGQVLVPKVTVFGAAYYGGPSMRERLKAAELLGKMNGWHITNTSELKSFTEAQQYLDADKRAERLEELRVKRARHREELLAIQAKLEEEE